MYRARVQAVSGRKIYADGKWLTCIGNKNFRTGEMVWTDGRCAYGHFQESQQPLIITAPDDEGIPILISNGTCFTFQNNKLKQVAETDFRYLSLINNKNKVFVHPYLAANIDNQGNIFVMAETYKTDDDYYIIEDKVVIFKNDKASPELKFNKVKEIDLLAWFNDEVVPKCPEAYSGAMDVPLVGDFEGMYYDTGHHYTPREIGYYTSGSSLYIRRAFIEDDNNFEFLVMAEVGESFHNADDYCLASSDYDITCQFKNDEKNVLTEKLAIGEIGWKISDFWLQQEGREFLEYITKYNPDTMRDEPIFNYDYPIDVKNTITCSAGDGYYYTMTQERINEESYGIYAYGEYRYKFFSPNKQQIAETHGGTDHKFLFRKVKGGYLIAPSHTLILYNLFGEEVKEIKSNNFFGNFFYSNSTKELKRLSSWYTMNERLRPMKKIKGWQKHIKEISLDLEEDEN